MVKNHFTATGYVFNSKNKILMIRHNKLKVWLPPGGHIDENELPDDAVLREIYEETGIKAEIVSNKQLLNMTDEYCRELNTPFAVCLDDIERNGTHNHINMIYICRALNENDDLIPQESEVYGIGWFAYEEIKKLETCDNVVKTISNMIEYLGDNWIG